MRTVRCHLFFGIVLLVLSGCSVAGSTVSSKAGASGVSGYVQKGPFIQGSSITIQELDASLNPTGLSYSTQTTDSTGSFTLASNLSSSLVEIIASGFYFNEVSGLLSTAPLTLRVYADISANPKVNINILTSLAHDRIKALVGSGSTFANAKATAASEVLDVFNIPSTGITDFDQMDISQSGDSNAALLAVSAITQGQNTVAQLSQLLSQLGTDIASNGRVTNSTNAAQLVSNSTALNLGAIRTNLAARYTSLGISYAIPSYENFVDSQGAGSINGSVPATILITGASAISDGMSKNITVNITGAYSETPLVVSVSSNDTSRVTVSAPTLTFSGSNFYLPQTVSLTGINGLSADATVTISAIASGLQTATLPLQFSHSPQISVLAGGMTPPTGFGALFTIDSAKNIYTFSGGSGSATPSTGVVKTTPSGVSTTLLNGKQVFFLAKTSSDSIYVFAFTPLAGGISAPEVDIISASGSVSTLCSNCGPNAYNGGVFDSSGGLYLVGTNTRSVDRFLGSGGTLAGANLDSTTCPDGTGANARFKGISGIAIDESDNIYVLDTIDQSGTSSCASKLRKITPTGVVSTIYTFSGSESARSGLAIDGAGKFYFATSSSIKTLTETGVESTYCGGGSTNAATLGSSVVSCSSVTFQGGGVVGFASTGELMLYTVNAQSHPNTFILLKISP